MTYTTCVPSWHRVSPAPMNHDQFQITVPSLVVLSSNVHWYPQANPTKHKKIKSVFLVCIMNSKLCVWR